MLELDIKADNARELIEQFHHYIGGSIDEKWSETILTIDNEFAKEAFVIFLLMAA